MSHSGTQRFAVPPRKLSLAEFVSRYGGVYEHSAWIAEQVFKTRLGAALDTVSGLATAMAAVVAASTRQQQLDLIRAHPDLGGKAAIRGDLTAESASEQSSAGLDQCSAEEYAQLQKLNTAYRDKFGFPFILAVRNRNRAQILAAMERRLAHDAETEISTALHEIDQIALLRLAVMAGAECESASDAADATMADQPTATCQQNQVAESVAVAQTSQRNPFHQWIKLEQPRLGTRVVYVTDDFFAAGQRLIQPAEPVFIDGKYDDHGKWMDGWESRRRRGPGHDYCVIQLGVPGVVHGVEIDTRYFTGNYPPEASLEACVCGDEMPGDDVAWRPLLARTGLQGDSRKFVAVNDAEPVTHVRFHIYPDGGVARLRLYGEVRPDWQSFDASQTIDLLALQHGGRALICNDEHYGSMHNLNVPGRGINMGDGWETARRRGPGHDWVILALGTCGIIESIEVDTAHFKGNYPDRVSIEALRLDEPVTDPAFIAAHPGPWQLLLPETKLSMDNQHFLNSEVRDSGPVTHVRMNIFPDGGISRLRLNGRIAQGH